MGKTSSLIFDDRCSFVLKSGIELDKDVLPCHPKSPAPILLGSKTHSSLIPFPVLLQDCVTHNSVLLESTGESPPLRRSSPLLPEHPKRPSPWELGSWWLLVPSHGTKMEECSEIVSSPYLTPLELFALQRQEA